MKLYILYAQRKERYVGEYAPEVLGAIDENGYSDNPDYLDGERAKALKTDEFESVVIVVLEVNGGKIMEALRPKSVVLSAEVISA